MYALCTREFLSQGARQGSRRSLFSFCLGLHLAVGFRGASSNSIQPHLRDVADAMEGVKATRFCLDVFGWLCGVLGLAAYKSCLSAHVILEASKKFKSEDSREKIGYERAHVDSCERLRTQLSQREPVAMHSAKQHPQGCDRSIQSWSLAAPPSPGARASGAIGADCS